MAARRDPAVALEGDDRRRAEGSSPVRAPLRFPEPDMDEALRLLRRLNEWTLQDGRLVSRAVRVDGFEPWWFSQEHLLWRILAPATRYREALEPWSDRAPLELRDPPDELRALVRELRRSHAGGEVRVVDSCQRSAAPRDTERKRGRRAKRAAALRLASHSLRSLVHFARQRPPALLYAVDRVTPGLGCDFRLHPVYRELERRREAFAEYVHVGQRARAADDLAARARPAVYFEYLDWLGRAFPSPAVGVPSGRDGGAEDRLLARVAARGLRLAVEEATRYRLLKQLLRLHRPRYALVMDDSRHTHALVAACKELRIPVVGVQHAVGFNRYYAGLACYGWSGGRSHAPDHYALWSDYFRDKLLAFSELFAPDDTFVCGNLRPPEPRPGPARQPAEGGKLRVLLVSEPKASPDELLPVVARLVAHEGFEVGLKVRPGEDLEAARRLFGGLFLAMQVVDTPSVHDAFAGCDVVVGLYSSVLYEALQAPKPVVALKTRSPYASDLAAEGLAVGVEDPEHACERVAQAAALPAAELERRRDRVWGHAFGRGVDRIFELVDRELARAAGA